MTVTWVESLPNLSARTAPAARASAHTGPMGVNPTSPVCFTWEAEDGSLYVARWDFLNDDFRGILSECHRLFGPPGLEFTISPEERRQLQEQQADLVWLR